MKSTHLREALEGAIVNSGYNLSGPTHPDVAEDEGEPRWVAFARSALIPERAYTTVDDLLNAEKDMIGNILNLLFECNFWFQEDDDLMPEDCWSPQYKAFRERLRKMALLSPAAIANAEGE